MRYGPLCYVKRGAMGEEERAGSRGQRGLVGLGDIPLLRLFMAAARLAGVDTVKAGSPGAEVQS